jgi:hypothetical protein
MEQIAMAIHDGWWAYQINGGYKLGPREERGRTHPHMLPWHQLDEESKNQDRFIAAILLAAWVDKGKSVTPDRIHEAWRVWEYAHGTNHPHNEPFKQAHPAGADEHKWQAERINEITGRWNWRMK